MLGLFGKYSVTEHDGGTTTIPLLPNKNNIQQDITDYLAWKIDFKQKILIMYPSDHLPDSLNSMHQLSFDFNDNRPYVYLNRKNSRFKFLLDTGAGKSSNISQRDYNLTNIEDFSQIELYTGNFDVNGVYTTTKPKVFRLPESTSKDVTISPIIYYNNLKSTKIGNYLWRDKSLFLSLKSNTLYVSSVYVKQTYDYYSCYVSSPVARIPSLPSSIPSHSTLHHPLQELPRNTG